MTMILRNGCAMLAAGLLLTGFCYAQEQYSDPDADPSPEPAVMYLSNADLPTYGHHYYILPPESPCPAAAHAHPPSTRRGGVARPFSWACSRSLRGWRRILLLRFPKVSGLFRTIASGTGR